jgi:uncharacterized protein
MPQYPYRIQPTRLGMISQEPTEREARVVDEHFRYLQELTARGVVLLAGRILNSYESTFGIVILMAASAAAAEQIVRNDPAVRDGVMHAELFPYRIALWSHIGLEKAASDT